MNKHIIIVGIALIIVAGGSYIFLQERDSLPSVGEALRDEERLSDEELREGTVEEVEERNTERYTNTTYGFSLEYPKGYKVGVFEEVGGKVILIQNPQDREGFQIYVAPFDEPGPITPERIKLDLPDLRIDEPQRVVVGGGNIEALIFRGESEEFGESREVWFVYGDNLYQVTTHADLDHFIGPIMESWRFIE